MLAAALLCVFISTASSLKSLRPTHTRRLSRSWANPSPVPVDAKVDWGSIKILDKAQSGCILVAPEHEYNHFLMEQAVLIYEYQETADGRVDAKGVILERPTAYSVNEMVPGFDEFSENVMFMGGEDGGNSVVMIHNHGELEGSRDIGSGLFIGGVDSARAALEKAAVGESRCKPLDFKFFFDHVRLSGKDLEGMLGEGGWNAISLPGKNTAAASLHNEESGLWRRIRRKLAIQTGN